MAMFLSSIASAILTAWPSNNRTVNCMTPASLRNARRAPSAGQCSAERFSIGRKSETLARGFLFRLDAGDATGEDRGDGMLLTDALERKFIDITGLDGVLSF